MGDIERRRQDIERGLAYMHQVYLLTHKEEDLEDEVEEYKKNIWNEEEEEERGYQEQDNAMDRNEEIKSVFSSAKKAQIRMMMRVSPTKRPSKSMDSSSMNIGNTNVPSIKTYEQEQNIIRLARMTVRDPFGRLAIFAGTEKEFL